VIAQDQISKIITLLGLSIPIYVFLFSNVSIIWLLPFFLIIGGFAIQKWLLSKTIKDVSDSLSDQGNIIFYTVVALATFIFLGLVTPSIVKIFAVELTGFDSVLFGVMMAIGEEQFFRAGWANILIQTSHSEIYGALAGAGVFGIYHFFAYGDNPAALMFVLGAGFTFILVDLKMNRVTPSLFAHIGNNLMAYSTVGAGTVAAALFQNSQVFILMGIIGLIVYLYLQRRKAK
jgi:hypothetical protein